MVTTYNQISSNKNRTYLIIFFFIAFISFFFFMIAKVTGASSSSYFILGLMLSLASGIGSYFYSDKMVLFMSGAHLASKERFFDLYTVVENMSIASGLPMPKVYVIDDPAPNAFATGRDPKHAVVCATTGLLEKLDRAELEGVIAHELSHVKNYDILVMSVVTVLVGTIAYVADWVMRSMFWGGLRNKDDDRKSNNLLLFVFVILLILSPIIATLIQLAVSRKREYLADASGALLNRNPDALADALVKISNDPHILHTATNATAHLFIANPFQKKDKGNSQKGFVNWVAGLFSTHPPIAERIKILREM
jgi:heat shock protein HtpX